MRNINIIIKPPKKQKGATLFTALVFLTLMTVVTVSASKISMMDLIVSSNNQQEMMVFQTTDSDLKELTTVPKLYKPLVKTPNHEFDETTGVYEILDSTKPELEQQITDKEKRYQCGGFAGKAISIGPSVSPCDLYDFEVRTKMGHSGVKDRHNRGAGKEKPNPGKDSYLFGSR